MKTLTIVSFLLSANCIAQVLPDWMNDQFEPKLFDSIIDVARFETFIDHDKEKMVSVEYSAAEYYEDNLINSYNYFENKEYKIIESVFYNFEKYNDGTCNCKIEIDTIFFSKPGNKMTQGRSAFKIDTIIRSKGMYEIRRRGERTFNSERFIYDKKHRLRKYFYGDSYNDIKYKNRYKEYRYFRADTVESGYAINGEVSAFDVALGITPTFYQRSFYDASGRIVKTFSFDDTFSTDLTVFVNEYTYNAKGWPIMSYNTRYEFKKGDHYSKNPFSELLMRDPKKLTSMRSHAWSITESKARYSYEQDKLQRIDYLDQEYVNVNGVFKKRVSNEEDYYGGKYSQIIEYTPLSISSRYESEGVVNSIIEVKFDEHKNFIEAKEYSYSGEKKVLERERKRTIIYE